ncbi:caspase domain-containing protein [Desulfobotulus alkaliphilus]|uniref:Caspase domain-containing protein n=1 Tax=Desulfobotulus alkaliphilus TaxID=622671 RepID=A0A562RTJ7_9BACT|nr:caspase family protein [Desulfobotulus alkaliphilus]TWI72445.1 caspase domain-containing protein [Desulfobotulus alkaliphilus]
MNPVKPLLCFAVFLLLATPALADTCPVARDIAAQAVKDFEKDRTRGLQLFIKAESLCPEPEYAANLAMAYWRFGAGDKAIEAMEKAVKAKAEPQWQANLASMYIDAGKNPARALSLAEAAVKSDASSPRYAHIHTEALLLAGQNQKALETIRAAKSKWSSEKRIAALYDKVLDMRMAEGLKAIQEGKADAGMAVLSGLTFDPKGARTHALSLAALGRTDAALTAAISAEKSFSGNGAVKGLRDEIISKEIASMYAAFGRGERAQSVARAKALHEKYPDAAMAKEGYDKLFAAFIGDASSIDVPAPLARNRRTEGSGGQADALIETIWSPAQDLAPPVSLEKSELVRNIPKVSRPNPHAVAVIIGNQRYAAQGRGIVDVAYAERDAAVMKKYLVSTMGYSERNIIDLTNATNSDLLSTFGTQGNPSGRLRNFIRDGESDVFIYYSGHGAPGPEGRAAYLVPVDAHVDYIASTGYSLDVFYDNLDQLPAKSLTVVLDACFSGDSAGGALFTNISSMMRNVPGSRAVNNALVFTSADAGQVATWYPDKGHTLFTYYFIAGLSGAADVNKDGRITAAELSAYLQREVPHQARRGSGREQMPVMTGDPKRVLATLK